jgi:competence protein ComEC
LNWKKIPRPGLVLATILVVAAADAGYWYYQRFGCRDLRVTVLDVGQGSANLLQLPGGRTVLVDGGGFGDNSTFDVGRSLVAPYLWRRKIKTVDLVVLTHPNSDHLNGLVYILDHFHVSEVWSNHEAVDTQGYRKWVETISKNGIIHPPFAELNRKQGISGVIFEILSPDPDFLQHGSFTSRRDENENSMVIKVVKGDVSFLFCGDIGWRTEKRLVRIRNGDDLESTVLLVPHHGSRYAGSTAFLRAVNPEHAVIPAGWRNRYRFPHQDLLKRLAAISCQVWRTDLNGAVRIATDGAEYSVKPALSSP